MATSVLYKIFIPQKNILAPRWGCSYGEDFSFGGDDRDFSNEPFASSRTRIGASVLWVYGGFRSGSENGETKVYNSQGVLVDKKTAYSLDMWVKQLDRTSTYADSRFRLKSSNPFCGYNSIQGAFTISVTKSD